MKLILVRHGQAPYREGSPERELSEQGRAQVLALADYLQRENFIPAKIVHSGVLRAEQTATILWESFAQCTPRPSLEVGQDLKSESPVSVWAERLEDWPDDLMLVGHMPYMSSMVKHLAGDFVDFPTGQGAILQRSTERHWGLLAKSF